VFDVSNTQVLPGSSSGQALPFNTQATEAADTRACIAKSLTTANNNSPDAIDPC
jgi:hypothetical protein